MSWHKFRYDYYTIHLPSDLFESPEMFLDYAIDQARESAKLHCTPCEWTVQKLPDMSGDEFVFRVRRKRNKT